MRLKDFSSQGTFIEKSGAGVGIRAFYTPTGHGTVVAENKEVKNFDRPCILEEALFADVAIIKAEVGDEFGTLCLRRPHKTSLPIYGRKITIVEVENLVKIGELKPENIHLPGIFVQYIYQGKDYQNDIEFLKVEN